MSQQLGRSGTDPTTSTEPAPSTTADPATLPEGSLLALAVLDQGELLIIDSGGNEVARLTTPDGTQVRSLYQPPGADIAVGVTLNGFVFTLDLANLSIVRRRNRSQPHGSIRSQVLAGGGWSFPDGVS